MTNRRLWQQVFGLMLIVLFLTGCGEALAEPTAAPTPVPPTAEPTATPTSTPTSEPPTPIPPTATYTPIPPTFTVTPIPTTKAPSVLIRLGPGKFGQPLWLEVVVGDYKLVSGATFGAGSAFDVAEDWMTFPPGLAIDVAGGDIVLKGATYSQGTKLIVDAQGNLIPR